MRDLGSEFQGYKLGIPTVMAFEDGELTGFLSTDTRTKGRLVAEPLVFKPREGNPTFFFMRLVEAYEAILSAARVPVYYFHIPHGYEDYIALVDKFGIPRKMEDEVGIWFERRLNVSSSSASGRAA